MNSQNDKGKNEACYYLIGNYRKLQQLLLKAWVQWQGMKKGISVCSSHSTSVEWVENTPRLYSCYTFWLPIHFFNEVQIQTPNLINREEVSLMELTEAILLGLWLPHQEKVQGHQEPNLKTYGLEQCCSIKLQCEVHM